MQCRPTQTAGMRRKTKEAAVRVTSQSPVQKDGMYVSTSTIDDSRDCHEHNKKNVSEHSTADEKEGMMLRGNGKVEIEFSTQISP